MPSVTLDKEYAAARSEHAFLLRCEGVTYREIGARMGISITRARQLACKCGRRLARAMKWTKVTHA